MTDQTTLAYINMYAVLGALTELARLDPRSRELLVAERPATLGIRVRQGPAARFIFAEGCCVMAEARGPTDLTYRFASPLRFNAMLAGERDAFCLGGLLRPHFVNVTLTGLTERLAAYLLPTQPPPQEPDFAAVSGALRFYVHIAALAQIANHDKEGQKIAQSLPDGALFLSVARGPAGALLFQDHRAAACKLRPEQWDACLEFPDFQAAEQWRNGAKAAGQGSQKLLRALPRLNKLAKRYLREGRNAQ